MWVNGKISVNVFVDKMRPPRGFCCHIWQRFGYFFLYAAMLAAHVPQITNLCSAWCTEYRLGEIYSNSSVGQRRPQGVFVFLVVVELIFFSLSLLGTFVPGLTVWCWLWCFFLIVGCSIWPNDISWQCLMHTIQTGLDYLILGSLQYNLGGTWCTLSSLLQNVQYEFSIFFNGNK